MQADRSAGTARLAGSVRGLGVCDVLRVELRPLQRAGLTRELDVRIAALERRRAALAAELRARPRATVARVAAAHDARGEEADAARLGEPERELAMLSRLRASLPAAPRDSFAWSGPAGLVCDLVAACLAAALAVVHRALDVPAAGPRWAALCPDALEVTAAWLATALDCRAVEDFCFEPGVDPVHPW